MATTRDAAKHAGSLYKRAFGWLLRPVRSIEREAHHLHELERAGEGEATPFIAILGVALFLLPILLLILGLSFAAYYLA